MQHNLLDIGNQLLASERDYNVNEAILKCQSPPIPMTCILVVNLGLFGLTIRTLTNGVIRLNPPVGILVLTLLTYVLEFVT